MPYLIQYILKLSAGLILVYLFYQLVLRRLTFYNWNRWYLLGYTLLAFFIPFFNLMPVLEKNEMTDNRMVQFIPSFDQIINQAEPGDQVRQGMNIWTLTFLIFLTGVFILLLRFVIQYISLRRIKKNATLISGTGIRLYHVNKDIVPFSFGNSVFINQSLHTEDEMREIILHEFVHVRQNHTIDILWSELLCILNWYNPFAWMLRKMIRQNLEFIADDKVVQNGIDKKGYQYLLLKVIGNNSFSIASNFNFSSLKKRIAMMNKIRSAKVHLIRFLFVLPLLAVLLLAFRTVHKKTEKNIPGVSHEVHIIDTLPDIPPPPPPPLLPPFFAGFEKASSKNFKNVSILVESNKGESRYMFKSMPVDVTAKSFSSYDEVFLNGKKINSPSELKNISIGLVHLKFKYDDSNQNIVSSTLNIFEKDDNDDDNVVVVSGISTKPTDVTVATGAVTTTETSLEPVVVAGTNSRQLVNPTVKVDRVSAVNTNLEPVTVQSHRTVDVVTTVNTDVRPVTVQGYNITDEAVRGEILLEITPDMTSDKLDVLKKELDEKGYTLKIENVSFNDGNLVSIRATVRSKSENKFASFNADDFSRIIVSESSENKTGRLHVRIFGTKNKVNIKSKPVSVIKGDINSIYQEDQRVKSVETTDNKILVNLKDGNTENYNTNISSERKAFEEKYNTTVQNLVTSNAINQKVYSDSPNGLKAINTDNGKVQLVPYSENGSKLYKISENGEKINISSLPEEILKNKKKLDEYVKKLKEEQ